MVDTRSNTQTLQHSNCLLPPVLLRAYSVVIPYLRRGKAVTTPFYDNSPPQTPTLSVELPSCYAHHITRLPHCCICTHLYAFVFICLHSYAFRRCCTISFTFVRKLLQVFQ